MNTCMAFKTDGLRCTNAPVHVQTTNIPLPPHLHFCRIHQRTYANRVGDNPGNHHVEGRCLVGIGGHGWCLQNAEPGTLRCATHTAFHDRRVARNAERLRREQIHRDAFAYLMAREPHPTWQQVARELFMAVGNPPIPIPAPLAHLELQRMALVQEYYRQRHTPQEPGFFLGGRRFVLDYWFWLQGGAAGREPQAADYFLPPAGLVAPPPVPRAPPTLAAIATDSQNVHRAVVSDQTNRNTDLLLATANVPDNLRAHELLAAIWLNLHTASWSHVRRTIDDVYAWRAKETCRTQGDWLYRRILHCLFMRIYRMPEGESRRELWKRFYEECSEAVGLCCEGHISRLCNVLVGFEEDFKPPVPFGELVQAKMSAISEMDIPLDDKVKLAMDFFEEHKVPLDARVAWLDAF